MSSEQACRIKEWVDIVQYVGLGYDPHNSNTQVNGKMVEWFEQLRQMHRPSIHKFEFDKMPQFPSSLYKFSNPSNANSYYQAYLELSPTSQETYYDYERPIFMMEHRHLYEFVPTHIGVIPLVGDVDQRAYENLLDALKCRTLPLNSDVCSYFTVLSFTKCLLMEMCGVNLRNYKSRLVFEIDKNIKYCNSLVGNLTHYNPYFVSTSSYSVYYEAFKKIVLDKLEELVTAGYGNYTINEKLANTYSSFIDDFNSFVPDKFCTDDNGYYCTYLSVVVRLYLALRGVE